jgi:hypothetical protein
MKDKTARAYLLSFLSVVLLIGGVVDGSVLIVILWGACATMWFAIAVAETSNRDL